MTDPKPRYVTDEADILHDIRATLDEIAARAPMTGGALVVEPGDMLVIGINQRINAAEADGLVAAVRGRMPGVRVCVLDGVAALAVVRAAASERVA